MLYLLAAMGFPRPDQIDLKVGGRRPHPLFYDEEYVGDLQRSRRPFRTAYLNGKRTKVVLPGTFDADETPLRNRAGRIAGSFSFIQGDLRHEAYVVGFATTRGRLELLPFRPEAIDEKGRVVGTKREPADPSMADPYDTKIMPKGVLWDHGRLFQLGPAEKVWFTPKGEVRGYCEVDRAGRQVLGFPMRIFGDPLSVRYRLFAWANGKRTKLETVIEEPVVPHAKENGEAFKGLRHRSIAKSGS